MKLKLLSMVPAHSNAMGFPAPLFFFIFLFPSLSLLPSLPLYPLLILLDRTFKKKKTLIQRFNVCISKSSLIEMGVEDKASLSSLAPSWS